MDHMLVAQELEKRGYTSEEIEKMSDIQKSLSTLIDGGYVGKPSRMIE